MSSNGEYVGAHPEWKRSDALARATAHPAPANGALLTETDNTPDPRDWLSAIVDGSDDAIISKDLSGTIRSWNAGATRLFGYVAEEVVGKPITILIPEDRLGEEPTILARIRQGERVDHFETVRRRKDGSPVQISLTISPIRNENGLIVGASKIARDITERRLAQEKQHLLFGEMQHRVKNLFALAAGIVSLSARSDGTVDEVVTSIHERLAALARAHDLTMRDWRGDGLGAHSTSLHELLGTILSPYDGQDRILIGGDNPPVGGQALTHIALLLHELATNAAKYGSLSVRDGQLGVGVAARDGVVQMTWEETGGPEVAGAGTSGFGSRLERSIEIALGASVQRDWKASGLVVAVRVPQENLVG